MPCRFTVLLLLSGSIPSFCHIIPLTFFGPLAAANNSSVFVAQGGSATVLFRAGGITFSKNGNTSRFDFQGPGSAAIPSGASPLPGRVNIAGRQNDLVTFGSIEYRSLYPGITLRFSAENGRLKSEYRVEARHNPSSIRLQYRDADRVSILADGSLAVRSGLGEIVEAAPVLYQIVRGRQAPVAGAYEWRPGKAVGFRVGRYDKNLPLVIDPVLTFALSIGGSGTDVGTGVSKDAAGNIYLAGWTDSTDFSSASPVLPRSRGVDAWVMKLDAVTRALVYLTYLGGAGDDRALGIAADADGLVYVCGVTTSPDFPVMHAQQPTLAGGRDGFVAKLDGAGRLLYSTYIGGSGDDSANAIAADRSGSAYVTGETDSPNLPVRTPIQAALAGGHDAFIAKFGTSGELTYATYLGGSGADRGLGIAVDPSGAAYITGSTESINFPVLAALQPAKAGGLQDAFVAKLNAAGTALVYSTYLGGSGGSVTNPEQGLSIAVDTAGNAYVVGSTNSTDFPVVNAFQSGYAGAGGASDAFAAKLNPAGSKLLYSTYLGGVGMDVATSVRVDTAGAALVAGYTNSPDFPTVQQVASGGGMYDAFLVKLANTGNQLLFSTLLGGQQNDSASSLSGVNETVVVGATSSADLFPGTLGLNVLIFGVQIAPAAPFGVVDTPQNGATGLSGAIGVTGWAFCEDQVPTIQILRDTVPGEPAYPTGTVYIGSAVFLPGARPDVAAAFPTYPYNDRAGWGVQILSNMLPNAAGGGSLGNGTYKLHAVARNLQGQGVEIGQRTVSVDNAHSVVPFGTIDTPGNGATISGNAYLNFGWAVTPQPNTIPKDGSTMFVYIDNVPVGHPVYNNFRSDIASLFPGLNNSNGAVGYYIIDTTKLSNGLHSLAWSVLDNAGHSGGIGSRLFIVQN
jgi:Beta-propeller repeat